MEPVLIPAALLAEVLAHAARTPRLEVCGLLFGGAGRIDRAKPAANVAADPARFFELDPTTLFRALRAERAGGPRIVGHYHSHPNGSADPSARDRAAAEPGQLWLIVAGNDARLWRAVAGGFQPLVMQQI